MPRKPEEKRAERAVEAARRFCREVILPHEPEWEAAGRVPAEAHRAAAKAGLSLVLLPAEAGGHPLGMRAVAELTEELAYGGLALTLPLLAHNYVAWSIADFGSDALRRRYLPDMLAGETLGVFSLTEPHAGSDAAALRTHARRVGSDWHLDGEKAWVCRVQDADFFIVYAQTEPGSGSRGIALFLVPGDTPGLERGAPYELLGGHAIGLGPLRLRDCRLPADALLAPPGRGLGYALRAIDVARASVSAMCCGLLRRALDVARDYVGGRAAFGQHLADFQGVQWTLADVSTDLEAARLLARHAFDAVGEGRAGTVPAAHAKKFAARAAFRGVSDCMQVMGAEGMKREHPLALHLAYAKMANYVDGATEIQNVVLSRALFANRA